MLHLRGKAVEEDRKDSGEEQRDEDEGLGPRSNVSLLDQHQHLKEKAEGVLILHVLQCSLYVIVIILQGRYKSDMSDLPMGLQLGRSLPRRNN